MINKETQVYQFKITLMGITPQIWRRIQVLGDNSFHDLHRAIQNAMGWDDYHLHQFEVMNPKIGEIDLIGDGHENLNGCKIKISKYFTEVSQRAFYEYDFGDSWGHNIILEKKLPVTNRTSVKNEPFCRHLKLYWEVFNLFFIFRLAVA